MRQRAELLPPVQQTHRQYHWPASGNKIADNTHRAGVAARCADPAVHQSVAVDLALIDSYDQLLQELEWAMVKTAQQHDAHTLSLLQTVPGIGQSLRLVRLEESPASARFPRVHEGVS